MAKSKYLMTEGSIKKKIIGFALPVFLGRLCQQLYNTVDSLVVGQLVGTQALAAVTSVGTLIFLLVGFFMGFSQGAGIIIGNYVGAENDEEVSKTVHTAVAVSLFFCVFMTAAGILMSPLMLRLLGTPDDVMPEATLYLRWYFAGITGLVLYNTFVGILQASGDSRHPLYYLIFSSVLNIVLDYCFIKFFGMGVDGAALATSISQLLSAVLAFHRLVRTKEVIRLSLRKVRFHIDKVRQIIHYGLPSALQACIIDVANLMIQSYVNSFGSAAMAGIGAYQKLEGIACLPTHSFSAAMATFISQNRGAGLKERMRKGIVFGTTSGVILLEIFGATMFLLAEPLLGFFADDPEVIAFGMQRANICAFFYCLLGFSHITASILRGLGKPTVPTFIMLFCWCFVRVGVLLTIGKVFHDIRLVCWIYPITWALSAVVYLLYLFKCKREKLF